MGDGSSFVGSARQQPAATTQALTYRAADMQFRRFKRGGLG